MRGGFVVPGAGLEDWVFGFMLVKERGKEGGREGGRKVLRNWPSRTVIRPAAEARAPCRKEECWKAPGCLMPM